MMHFRLLLAAILMILAGCGEPAPPRFVPATGRASAKVVDRESTDKPPRPITIPKNIEMH